MSREHCGNDFASLARADHGDYQQLRLDSSSISDRLDDKSYGRLVSLSKQSIIDLSVEHGRRQVKPELNKSVELAHFRPHSKLFDPVTDSPTKSKE